MEDVDAIIDQIRKEPTLRTRNTPKPQPYDNKTIDGTIIPCIVCLFVAADQNGFCEDLFWVYG